MFQRGYQGCGWTSTLYGDDSSHLSAISAATRNRDALMLAETVPVWTKENRDNMRAFELLGHIGQASTALWL